MWEIEPTGFPDRVERVFAAGGDLGEPAFPRRPRLSSLPRHQCPRPGTLGRLSWKENSFPREDDALPSGAPDPGKGSAKDGKLVFFCPEENILWP